MKVVNIYINSKFFKLGLCLFVFNTFFSFTIFNCFIPNLELIGGTLRQIPVGTSYQEEGYKAYTNIQDLTDKVTITGEVDTKKLGKYKVKYKVKSFLFTKEEVRIVEVIDNEAPIIELKGNKDVYICPNSTYQEIGYQVRDNYDKDLTSKVITKEKDNIIYYEISDSSGNKTIQERILHYEDKEKPKITLTGNSKIIVYRNETYKELGYKATDNCTGDITNKVKVTNQVNTSKLGTYKITYEVEDNSGNKTNITRTIQVIDKVINQNGTIYLTFDDGPSSTITAPILNILKDEGVQATFFVINSSDSLNYLIKREYDEGHTVAIHSYTHNYANIYKSTTNYFNDLEKIQNKVRNITGETSKIIRFPGGSSNTISRIYKKGIMSELTKEVVKRGYHYFDWNVSSGDADGVTSSKQVYQNVTSNLSVNRANVVLMHDFENSYYTLNALRDIIQFGKKNGYTFKKITMDTGMITHGVAN